MTVKLVYDTIYDNLILLIEDRPAYIQEVVLMFEEFSIAGKITDFNVSVDTNTLTRTNTITYADRSAWEEYFARLNALELVGSLMNSGYTERNAYVEYEDGSRVYFN